MDITIIEEFLKLLTISFPLGCTVLNIRALTKAKLQRKSFSGEITINPSSLLNRLSNFSKDEIDYAQIEILKPYVEKLCEYVPIEDMKVVRKNIRTVTVEKKQSLLIKSLSGFYDYFPNEITYRNKNALGHEFLHMCSSVYNKENDTYFSGLMYEDEKNSIGESLNEGYTELLNHRLYDVSEDKLSYRDEVRMVKLLELFFEDEKELLHLYFSCDLLGFIKKLENYAPRKEIIELIIDMDNYTVCKYNGIFLATIKSISIYERIYKWFIAKSNDQEKLQKLEELINEDKIVSIIINKEKMKLCRDSFTAVINNCEKTNISKKR